MDLQKLDRTKYLYDPLDEDLVHKLTKYKEFRETIPRIAKRQAIQYIILMYDKNNDEIRAEFPFYPQRKMEVARTVGLIPGKKVSSPVEDMLVGKNEKVNKMIIRYLTLFNDPDLLMLSAYYTIYIELTKRSLSGNFDKSTITDIERVNASIKDLSENIFGGKDETELRQELYKSIEEQSLGIRPEEIAEIIKEDKVPLEGFNPYQENYKPEEIKFIGDK